MKVCSYCKRGSTFCTCASELKQKETTLLAFDSDYAINKYNEVHNKKTGKLECSYERFKEMKEDIKSDIELIKNKTWLD